jgi:uncharacterized membrane protein
MDNITKTKGERRRPRDPLAQGLGWASLGLGVPMTTMPGRFVEALGIRSDAKTKALAIGVGLQEYACAAGILTQPRPAGWLWARVAGDAMHFTMLARSLRGRSFSRTRTIAAMAGGAGIGVADTVAAMRITAASERAPEKPDRLRAAITVRKPRDEVYRFWHDFENLPSFMGHLEQVERSGNGRSHWRAKGPVGTVQWDAEVVEDRPGELISWRSVDGSSVQNSGTVRFVDAPGDRGTEVHVDLDYRVPGGAVGTAVAKVLGEEPTQQVKDDLRRFKQVAETGVLMRSEGTPEGQHAGRMLKQRPAQPLPEAVGPGRS